VKPVGVIGNVCRDRVDGRVRVGGGPFYAARALRALGRKGLVLTKCADADRRLLLTPLVCVGLPVLWREAPATAAFAIDYEGEERSMAIEALGPEWSAEEMGDWVSRRLAGVEWVQVAPLRRDEFPPAALAQLARGRRLLFDGQGLVRPPRLGPVTPDADFDPAVLEHVAALKLSEPEARLLGELDGESLGRLGVPEVLVTLGSRGVLVLDRGRLEHVAGRPVEPVADPTGAGDAFGAAYVAARAAGNRPVGAARQASSLVADLLAGRIH
jgi:sugar/nucleoside kinase (ribokinase family)